MKRIWWCQTECRLYGWGGAKATNCGTYQTHGTHPDLRGLMTWSINWDHFNSFDFQNNFTSYFG